MVQKKKNPTNNVEIMADCDNLVPVSQIETMIFSLRGTQVMLDSDLAVLYGIETRTLNQAVKRNLSRFPEDFMFRLTKTEFENLKSQFVTSSERRERTNLYAKHLPPAVARLAAPQCAVPHHRH